MPRIAIATKHNKDQLLGLLFYQELDWHMELVEFDTDSLGTFSPEVKRVLSPRDAALAKARIALEQSEADYGLGSEGSIHPHPYLPLISLDTEVLALVDRAGFELVVTHTSHEIVAVNRVLDSNVELETLAQLADMPNHAVIVRSSDGSFVAKGIRELEELRGVLAGKAKGIENLILESDFRAMSSPSRSKNIMECARKLIQRFNSSCPSCEGPGWGVTGFDYGVPCADCGTVNHESVKCEILGCPSCSFTLTGEIIAETIPPSQCVFCNP